VKPDLNSQTYNYKESERLKENLSQYMHLYSRTNYELNFESSFIQDGLQYIKEATDFIENYVTKDVNGIHYSVLDFMNLSEPMKAEFQKWLFAKEQDNKELTKRLIEIVKSNKNLKTMNQKE
jgi:hypothetical protein